MYRNTATAVINSAIMELNVFEPIDGFIKNPAKGDEDEE